MIWSLMQRNKIILLSTVCGAVAGALATRLDFHVFANVPAFARDNALLAHRQWMLAVLGWVLFSLYWEVAAKNAAAAKSSESRPSRGIHVVLANVALMLEMAPIYGLGRLLPLSAPIMAAGLAVEAMGLLLAIWARRHLGRNWSGEITIKVEHQLIRSGPYKLLRHPIYTGLLAMYAGAALVTGEWLAMVGLAMAAFAYWRKIRLEEVNLNVAFGADYDAYRQETWALVPGLF
jgi:protein-S-isoprenylcysteine O-methyltransferase Ste14